MENKLIIKKAESITETKHNPVEVMDNKPEFISKYAPEYYEDLANGKLYLRTRKCGCGECRMHPPKPEGCELRLSKTAIWLYTTNFTKKSIPVHQDEGDPGFEIKEVTGTEL